ncbi:MAG: hypothetical protein KatS3mg052_1515 [Candidatus Roseilinea sp.]|nr:MAG: hypothetical protein KatS3mg052_1515 [Candidatus Roseilinea sp.]
MKQRMNPPTRPTLTATVPPNASEKGRSKRLGPLRRHLRHGIGQIIRPGRSAALLPDALAEVINQTQRFLIIEETWPGIPAILHKECCAGAMVRQGAIVPQLIGLASAFQPNLIAEMTEGYDTPKLRFFDEAPKPLLDKVEQVARIIRSKGVGVFFVTQNPMDIPDVILSRMGSRVQHALRAFTPRDQKAMRAAATTLCPNPKVNIEQAIAELGVGEALVSCLDEKGMPGVVERAPIVPPRSQMGPITPEQRRQLIASSPVYGYYEKPPDRESAHRMLAKQVGRAAAEAIALKAQKEAEARAAKEAERLARAQAKQEAMRAKQRERRERERQRQAECEAHERQKVVGDGFEAFAKSAARSLGGSTGAWVRGILGGLSSRPSRKR